MNPRLSFAAVGRQLRLLEPRPVPRRYPDPEIFDPEAWKADVLAIDAAHEQSAAFADAIEAALPTQERAA